MTPPLPVVTSTEECGGIDYVLVRVRCACCETITARCALVKIDPETECAPHTEVMTWARHIAGCDGFRVVDGEWRCYACVLCPM